MHTFQLAGVQLLFGLNNEREWRGVFDVAFTRNHHQECRVEEQEYIHITKAGFPIPKGQGHAGCEG